MVSVFIQHRIKSLLRSRNAGRNIVMQVFVLLMVLYMLLSSLVLGFLLKTLLEKVFPTDDVVVVFTSFLLYYFLFDIVIRFIMQDLPGMVVQPYLVQSIRRNQLVRFLNLESLVSLFNLLPLVLFGPFAFAAIAPTLGLAAASGFVITIIALTLFNNFLVFYLKRKIALNAWWLVIFLCALLAIAAADYFQLLSFRSISSSAFGGLLAKPYLVLVPVVLCVVMYTIHSKSLRHNLYFDVGTSSPGKRTSLQLGWLSKFGMAGELIALEIKLIMRNKRPRTTFLFSMIFLLYGLVFYRPDAFDKGSFGLLMFISIFVSGVFVTNYGQFLYAWQSSHFDGLLVNRISTRLYIKSKLLLMVGVCSAVVLVTLFYGFINWRLIPILIASFFFNAGIQSVLAAYISTYNYKSLQIEKGASFNYQGIGIVQWLYGVFVVLVASLFYLPFAFILHPWAGVIALGLVGVIALLLQDWWVGILAAEFDKRKYKILEGFREK